jgi:hypothetical protein
VVHSTSAVNVISNTTLSYVHVQFYLRRTSTLSYVHTQLYFERRSTLIYTTCEDFSLLPLLLTSVCRNAIREFLLIFGVLMVLETCRVNSLTN